MGRTKQNGICNNINKKFYDVKDILRPQGLKVSRMKTKLAARDLVAMENDLPGAITAEEVQVDICYIDIYVYS